MAKRNNNVSDFLSTFQTSFNMTNGLMKQNETSKIATAEAEESQVINQKDADQLSAIASAKREDGSNYYRLEPGDGGGYKVHSNSAPVDGEKPEGATIAPSTVTDFLGKRHDGALSDKQLTKERQNAMANVMEKYGDTEGAVKYRSQLTQAEQAERQSVLTEQQIASGARVADAAEKDAANEQKLTTIASYKAEVLPSDVTNGPQSYTVKTTDGSMKSFGTEAEAQAYEKQFNGSDSQDQRQIEALRSQGRLKEAMGMEVAVQTRNRAMYDAGRQEIWRNALTQKNPQGFVDSIYKDYNDGGTATVVMNPDSQGGRVDQTKDGKVTGSLIFKDMEDLQDKAYGMVFPDKAFEIRRAARAANADLTAKHKNAMLLQGLKNDGRPISSGSYVQNDDGSYTQVGESKGSPGGRGASGKAPATPLDGAREAVSRIWKEATPQEISQIAAAVPAVMSFNPGVDKDVAAWAAGAASDEKNIVPAFDMSKMSVRPAVRHPQSGEVFVGKEAPDSPEAQKALAAGVPAWVQASADKDPAKTSLMLRAAGGDKKAGHALYTSMLETIRAQVAVQNPRAKPAEIDALAKQLTQRNADEENRRIKLLSKYAPGAVKDIQSAP